MYNSANPWLLVLVSIVAEFLGTVALRYSDGFALFFPALISIGMYVAAIYLMALASTSLGIGLLYSCWAVGSAVLITVGSLILFEEKFSSQKSIGMIFALVALFLLNIGGEA
ncbi:DMT family transporter [Stutzerimonas chloritidismutans]